METLAPPSTWCHTTIRLVTERPTQFIDVTDRLNAAIASAGIRVGLAHVQTLHTTTGIVVNEHEPLLLGDFEAVFERLAPRHRFYRHDDACARTVNRVSEERVNGHAHCRALLLGASAGIAVIDGRLHLGSWQRVFLVELDGPRERDISIVLFGEAGR